jgi:hypothetical protein
MPNERIVTHEYRSSPTNTGRHPRIPAEACARSESSDSQQMTKDQREWQSAGLRKAVSAARSDLAREFRLRGRASPITPESIRAKCLKGALYAVDECPSGNELQSGISKTISSAEGEQENTLLEALARRLRHGATVFVAIGVPDAHRY